MPLSAERMAALRRGLVNAAKEQGHSGSKYDFQFRTFAMTNNVPSPGLGMFDVSYDPNTGYLDVVVKLCIDDSKAILTNAAQWQNDGSRLVSEYWNSKFEIRCTRSGWDFVVKPRFELRFVPEAEAYFIPIIEKFKGGDPDAFISTDVSPRSTNNLYPQRHGKLQDASVEVVTRQGYQEGVIKQLRHVELVFEKGFNKNPFEMKLLETWVNDVKSAMRGVKLPKVTVTAVGGGVVQRNTLINEVKAWLAWRGIEVSSSINFWGKAAPAAASPYEQRKRIELNNVLRVVIQMDETALNAAVGRVNTVATPSVFAQPTIVHEYGHMIGLPDEYRCITDSTADRMVELGLISEQQKKRWLFEQQMTSASTKEGAARNLDSDSARAILDKYKDDPEALRIYRDYMSSPHRSHILLHQQRYIKLCSAAGVTPPVFGRKTTSMMSAGTVFYPHHAVTVWEALCRITKFYIDPSEWQIHVKASV